MRSSTTLTMIRTISKAALLKPLYRADDLLLQASFGAGDRAHLVRRSYTGISTSVRNCDEGIALQVPYKGRLVAPVPSRYFIAASVREWTWSFS